MSSDRSEIWNSSSHRITLGPPNFSRSKIQIRLVIGWLVVQGVAKIHVLQAQLFQELVNSQSETSIGQYELLGVILEWFGGKLTP